MIQLRPSLRLLDRALVTSMYTYLIDARSRSQDSNSKQPGRRQRRSFVAAAPNEDRTGALLTGKPEAAVISPTPDARFGGKPNRCSLEWPLTLEAFSLES